MLMSNINLSFVPLIQLLFSAILHANFDDCLVIIANLKISTEQETFELLSLPHLTNNITMYLFDDAVHFKKITPSDRCLNYIIHHSDLVGSMEKLENYMHNDSYSRYNNRKYLLFTNTSENIAAIFNTAFVRSIPNLVVALIKIQNDNHPVVEFYYQSHLGSKVSLLDRWYFQDGVLIKQNGVDLYPEKIANGAHGTVFRVGPGYMIPYTDPWKQTGLYWEFTKLFVSRFNLTFFKYQTRTLVPDMLRMLDNGTLDLAFSMLMLRHDRYRISDFVTPPVTTRIGMLVPKPTLTNGWFTYINLFTLPIWLSILGIFTCLSIFFLTSDILMKFRSKRRKICTLNVLGLMVNQPIAINMKNSGHFDSVHLRFGFVVMAVACLLFTSIYCTKLSSNIILPLYDQKIDTITQLAQSDISIVTDDPYIPKPIAEDPNVINRLLSKRIQYQDEDKLKKSYVPSVKHAYFAYKFSKVFNLNRFQNESVLETHRLMADVLYDVPTTPYLMKNSAYLETMNTFMLRLIQHGILEHWTSKSLMMDEHMAFPLDIERIQSMAIPATPLRLSQIVGSLLIFSVGIVISLIALLIELMLFYRYR